LSAVNLDLTEARLKFQRAEEHVESFKTEISRIIEQARPYTITISPVDPQSGWADISLHTKPILEPRLGILYGDVLHNLRGTLDYIVSALALASGFQPAREHMFPIRDNQTQYEKEILDPINGPNPKGPLKNITVGLDAVTHFQPYRLQPNPTAHALFILNWQANADKHRRLIPAQLVPSRWRLSVRANPGQIAEVWEPARLLTFKVNTTTLVGRVRVNLPFFGTIECDANMHSIARMEGPAKPTVSAGPEPREDALMNYVRGMLAYFEAI